MSKNKPKHGAPGGGSIINLAITRGAKNRSSSFSLILYIEKLEELRNLYLREKLRLLRNKIISAHLATYKTNPFFINFKNKLN